MRSRRVSSTASQAGETDQIMRIDSTEHPVLSACIPHKKPQAKKSPSEFSVETAYEPTPRRSVPKGQTSTEPFSRSISDQSYQKTQCNDQLQQKCNLPLQIHCNQDTSECPRKISTPFQFSCSAIEIRKQHQNPQNHSNPVSRQKLK